MTYEFNHLANNEPEKLEEMQASLDTVMGDKTFDIKDPVTMAEAKSVLNFQRTPEKITTVQDPRFMANERAKAQARDFEYRKRLAQFRHNLGEGDDDKLAKDSAAMVDALASGDTRLIRGVLAPAINQLGKKIGGSSGEKPIFLSKAEVVRRGGNFETFKREAKRLNAMSVNGTFSIDESDAALKEMWDQGAAMMSVPVASADPADSKKTITKYVNIASLKNRRDNDAGKMLAFLKAAGAPDNKKGVLRFGEPETMVIDNEEDLGTGNE